MDEDRIAEIAERGGMTEDEARIFYHLDKIRELYGKLPRQDMPGNIRWFDAWNTMIHMLGERVLHRERPEIWRRQFLDPEPSGPEDDLAP
jgi:hypothetical protein